MAPVPLRGAGLHQPPRYRAARASTAVAEGSTGVGGATAAAAAAAAEVAAGYRHVPSDADWLGYLPYDGWGRPISRATFERLQATVPGGPHDDAATEARLEAAHFDPGADETTAIDDPVGSGSGWLAWRED